MRSFLALLLFPSILSAQSAMVQIEENMVSGVYRIEVSDKNNTSSYCGTAFIAEYKHKCYLITAKHLFLTYSLADSVNIKINEGSKQNSYKMQVYFDGTPESSDIAVLPIFTHVERQNIACDLDTPLTEVKMGDPILYLGFPSTLTTYENVSFNTVDRSGNISPLVKRGYFSGYDYRSTKNSIAIFDTQNTSGFSGSPVFVYSSTLNKKGIFAVLTAGVNANIKVSEGHNLKTVTDMFYMTGLSYGSLIGYATLIIDNLIK